MYVNSNITNNDKTRSKKTNKNKLIVFTQQEINILKDKKASFDVIDKIKLFKNIFDGIIIS